MFPLSCVFCFHRPLSALKANFTVAYTYKRSLHIKKPSIHLSVFLFKSLTSSLAESKPCFLFSLFVWPSTPIFLLLSHLRPILHFAVFTCDVSHQIHLHPPLCSVLQCRRVIIPFVPQGAQCTDFSLFMKDSSFSVWVCALPFHAVFLMF